MFGEVINHTYGAIFDGLDQSQRDTQALLEIKEHLVAGVAKLHSSGAFEGEAGQQLLHVMQQQIGQQIDECAAHITATGHRAVEQQHQTHALDMQGCRALGG